MHNRKIKNIIFGIIAGIGIILIVITLWFIGQKNRFVKFTNYEDGYAIEYPAEWTFTEGYGGVSVVFFSKQDNAMDTFKENVSVNIQDITNNPKTLKEYTDEAISQMESIFNQYMVVIESSNTYLDGVPAHKFVIIAKNKDKDMQLVFVWAIDGLKVYQLTFTSLTNTFERYQKTFEKMQNSFVFLR